MTSYVPHEYKLKHQHNLDLLHDITYDTTIIIVIVLKSQQSTKLVSYISKLEITTKPYYSPQQRNDFLCDIIKGTTSHSPPQSTIVHNITTEVSFSSRKFVILTKVLLQ